MTASNSGAERSLGPRLIAPLAIVIAAGAAAYYFSRPPVAPVQPAKGPAAGEKPNATVAKPPSIPFKDVTQDSNVSFVQRGGATGEKMLPESGGSGCAFFDYDQDGDADLLLISGRPWPWNEAPPGPKPSTLALYRNDAGRFTDVTAEAGLTADFYGQGVAVGDYEGDGDDDLFLTAVGANHMFRNDKGRFTEVTAETGVAGRPDDWTTSAGFFDYDRDGDLDLFVCNYLHWTRERDQKAGRRVPGTGLTYAHPSNFDGTQNYLYRNDGGRFVDVSADAGIRVNDPATGRPLGKALAVTFVDFDKDGWPDVFVANDTVRHFLFRNRGDGKFEEVGRGRGFALNALGVTTSGMGVDFGWIHNDDRLAVAVSNFAGEMTAFYISQPSAEVFFTDEAVATGVSGPTRDRLSFGLLFDDFDLDGRTDMVQANGHLEESINTVQPNQQYAQSAQLFWNAGEDARHVLVSLPKSDVGDLAKPIVGRGLASADVDGDGDLDLVLTQVDGPPLLARNDQKLGGHWLRCRLEGPAGNPHAIGAVLELRTGDTTQRRVVMPTRSYLSQTEPVVTFGLGSTDKVKNLLVTWPDGSKQTVAPGAVDREVTIRQDTRSFSSLTNTAKAQLENAKFEDAITTLKLALELRPDSAPTRRNLARAYLLGGQLDAAIKELGGMPQQTEHPSVGIAYLLGLAAIRQSRYDDAVNYFRQAVELDPNEATLHFQLALAFSAIGKTDEAKVQLEKTAALDPLHGGAQYQLATYARKAGDQQAFNRYMRDYQRIRRIKGPADALALEECRYTKPESVAVESSAVQSPHTPPPKPIVTQWRTEAPSGAPRLVAAAVLAMEDSGRYQLVGVDAGGHLMVFEFDESGGVHELARTEKSIGDVGDAAIVVVGNALVDAPYRPSQKEELGDYPEIAIVTPRQTWFVRYTPGQGFSDSTASSKLAGAKGDAARWTDLDHDGDIDLCLVTSGKLNVWRNNGDGTFVEATKEFGLSDAAASADFAAVDLDGVNLGVDLALAGPGGSTLERNQYGGRFAQDKDAAASWPPAERILADDFNNDGLPDFVFASAKRATIVLAGDTDQQKITTDLDTVDAVSTIDVDNDGWLDFVISGQAAGKSKVELWRNNAGRFADAAEILPISAAIRRDGMLDLDADYDGDTDLLLVAADGNLALLRNETSTKNRQLKLALRSFAGHPSSIGVRVQVRREDFVATRWTQRELPIEIGMGPRSVADSIQTLWMNGVARNEIAVTLADKPLRISIIEFVRTSSCPFLYAWMDGTWQFVTDLLGTAPLNVSVARNVPMPPDSDEVIVLGPAERLADGDTAARLRITTELREATYLDEVRLVAVDHPAGTTIFSRDRAAMTGTDGKQFAVGRDPIPLRSARGSDALDRTAALATEDGLFAGPGALLPQPVVGFTKPLSIEFDFRELPTSDDLLLVLTGWFRYGDSSTNIAGSQRGDLQVIWPRLEVAGADGRWQMVNDMVGFPSGNTKTIVCDLKGKIPADARRFRLTTSFEVRWDRFALYHTASRDAIRVTEVEPAAADLEWHGFAELRPQSFARPQVPNLARVSDVPPWFTALEGWCTRYGDVVSLVKASDEQIAILNSGDGATIDFPARDLPPREPGSMRTLLLYDRGWIKEENPNSLSDRGIEPFPGSERVPRDGRDDWQLKYNTRWVPRNRFARSPAGL